MSALLRWRRAGAGPRRAAAVRRARPRRSAPGEALHVTGPNGSGKSSLIRLVAGLLRAERGPDRARRRGAGRRRAGARPGAAAGPRAGLLGGPASCARRLTAFELEPIWPTSRSACCRPARPSGRGWRGWSASGAPLWLLDEPLNGLDRKGVGRLDRGDRRAPRRRAARCWRPATCRSAASGAGWSWAR